MADETQKTKSKTSSTAKPRKNTKKSKTNNGTTTKKKSSTKKSKVTVEVTPSSETEHSKLEISALDSTMELQPEISNTLESSHEEKAEPSTSIEPVENDSKNQEETATQIEEESDETIIHDNPEIHSEETVSHLDKIEHDVNTNDESSLIEETVLQIDEESDETIIHDNPEIHSEETVSHLDEIEHDVNTNDESSLIEETEALALKDINEQEVPLEEPIEEISGSTAASIETVSTPKRIWFKIKEWYHCCRDWLHSHHKTACLLKVVTILILLCCLIFGTAVGSNIAYMQYQYKRTKDGTELKINRNRTWYIEQKKEYHALTYNIGFGAHTPQFSHYFSTGKMKNGKTTRGQYNFGISKEAIEENMSELQKFVKELDQDLYLFQDVDIASTRSYMLNEQEILATGLNRYSRIAAPFQHSAYLFYPYPQERGLINTDLISFSRYKTTYGMYNQLPMTASFFDKFSEPDYGFSACWLPVSGTDNKYLVLINVNLTMKEKDRKAQLAKVRDFAMTEFTDGNYVIIGGSLNIDLSSEEKISEQQKPKWLTHKDNYSLPEGFSIVENENETDFSSWRSNDISYQKGTNYEAILDGFIVSNNITATAKIVDTQFKFSNHNPIELVFKLNK